MVVCGGSVVRETCRWRRVVVDVRLEARGAKWG